MLLVVTGDSVVTMVVVEASVTVPFWAVVAVFAPAVVPFVPPGSGTNPDGIGEQTKICVLHGLDSRILLGLIGGNEPRPPGPFGYITCSDHGSRRLPPCR